MSGTVHDKWVLDRDIVRLLSEGLTDESVADRLDVSIRTVRRHVADLMVVLGASSRFQAGVLTEQRAQAQRRMNATRPR